MRTHKIKKGPIQMSPYTNEKANLNNSPTLYQNHRNLTAEDEVLYSGGELITQLKAENRADIVVFLRPKSSPSLVHKVVTGCECEYKTPRRNSIRLSLSRLLAPSHLFIGACLFNNKNLKEANHG